MVKARDSNCGVAESFGYLLGSARVGSNPTGVGIFLQNGGVAVSRDTVAELQDSLDMFLQSVTLGLTYLVLVALVFSCGDCTNNEKNTHKRNQ